MSWEDEVALLRVMKCPLCPVCFKLGICFAILLQKSNHGFWNTELSDLNKKGQIYYWIYILIICFMGAFHKEIGWAKSTHFGIFQNKLINHKLVLLCTIISISLLIIKYLIYMSTIRHVKWVPQMLMNISGRRLVVILYN